MELKNYVLKLKEELEKLLGCGIEIVEDREIPSACKMEYAHNYARDRYERNLAVEEVHSH